MKNLAKIILGSLFLFTALVKASPWDESFTGLTRPAEMDTLGSTKSNDPFAIAATPSWTSKDSSLGLLLASQNSWLGHKVNENPRLGFLSFALQEHGKVLKFGLLGTIPLGESQVLDTGAVSGRVAPWNTRARQLHFQPSLALQSEDFPLSVGLALPISFNTTAQADLDFDSTQSNSRFKAGLEPKMSYILSLSYEVNERWQASLAYKEEQTFYADVSTSTQVPLPGELDVALEGEGRAPYLFEPRRVTLQSSYQISSRWRIGIWTRYSQWSEMPAPYLGLNFSTPDLQPAVPKFSARDTLEAASGLSFQPTPTHRFSGAYKYQPSPFKEAPHYYDSNQHHLGLAYSWSPAEQDFSVHTALRFQFLEKGGLYSYVGLGLSSAL